MLTFWRKSLKFHENHFCAKIFRWIWTVAAGRITFAKCAFSFFIFHKNFMNFHQKSPTRKYAMNSYGFWVPREAEIALFAKSRGRVYIPHFWQKSPNTTHVSIILGQNWDKRRKSALFAKKCTFGPFGLPGGSQNDSNSLGFGARAPLGPILAKKYTFRTFAHLGRGELTAIVLGPGRPPLRRATARGVGSIPLHGRSPSVPTHTRTRQWGWSQNLSRSGLAALVQNPLTPITF